MNENLTEFLWVRLQSLFVSLNQYVCSSKDDVIHNVGRSSNDAFLLRAYLTFMKNNNGEEIAVTVDVINRNGNYSIEADICGEDGLILAEGPSAEMMELTEKELSSWLEEYEYFLQSSQILVKEKVSELE